MDVSKIFICEECGSAYTGKEIYSRHLEVAHSKKTFTKKIIESSKAKAENVKSAPDFAGASPHSYLKENDTKKTRADFPRVSIDPFDPKEKVIEEIAQGIASERLAKYLEATGSALAKEIPKQANSPSTKKAETGPKPSDCINEVSKSLLPVHLDIVKLSEIPPILGLQLEVSMGLLTNWCNQVEKYIQLKKEKKGLFRAKKKALLSNFEKLLVQCREYINNSLRPEVKKCTSICTLLEQQFNQVEGIRTRVNVITKGGSYSSEEISEIYKNYKEISKTFLREITIENKKVLFWNATVNEIYNQVKEMTNSFNDQIENLSREFSSKIIFTLFLPQKVIFLE